MKYSNSGSAFHVLVLFVGAMKKYKRSIQTNLVKIYRAVMKHVPNYRRLINVIQMLQKSMTLVSDSPAPLCNEFPFLNNIELYKRSLMLFNRYLPTRCHKTSLRAFISWIAGMALSMR